MRLYALSRSVAGRKSSSSDQMIDKIIEAMERRCFQKGKQHFYVYTLNKSKFVTIFESKLIS